MSGFNNPFKVIPEAIYKSIKRKITRKEKCAFCDRKKHLDDLEKDYLYRYVCKDSKGDLDCKNINEGSMS